ncbi:adenylyl-sulfate kinase [Desulfoluna spongiiphila]|uniref:Adenylyl-sulfate kinase n=1 Tax=Desulfoluna spongiiphila TaxID=419481 RepID=A0A1G5BSV7_9BACT|nr:adenylyl-sulfate kinase [Desulfoluna spongiiphila]SCX93278.1 adenylylsulfate kinase/bifunctional enzyme CysN/CysC [Desulfoluna spongiiphila]VVS93894.1 adenylyl-sulfate kinase [Desulfoluna spongiiphila]
MTTRVFTHNHPVTPEMRTAQKGHPPLLLWFTGLSGSGKSTVAGLLEQKLHDEGIHTALLDGDNVRAGLNRDLGLSPAHRRENIRRIGEVAGLFLEAGLVTLCAFISPSRQERDALRKTFGDRFVEIHVSTPLEVCMARDPKGLYAKAEKGLLSGMTGLDAPYEPPENPDLAIDTAPHPPEACARLLFDRLFPLLKRQP